MIGEEPVLRGAAGATTPCSHAPLSRSVGGTVADTVADKEDVFAKTHSRLEAAGAEGKGKEGAGVSTASGVGMTGRVAPLPPTLGACACAHVMGERARWLRTPAGAAPQKSGAEEKKKVLRRLW